MKDDYLYPFTILAVLLAIVMGVALAHNENITPGDCFQDGSATIFRAKYVGKHSIYFTTDDEWNSRVIFALEEIPDHLHRIDCPETLIPCHGGQVCSLSPSHSQVSTPDTD